VWLLFSLSEGCDAWEIDCSIQQSDLHTKEPDPKISLNWNGGCPLAYICIDWVRDYTVMEKPR
jgi:hypothetical protein